MFMLVGVKGCRTVASLGVKKALEIFESNC